MVLSLTTLIPKASAYTRVDTNTSHIISYEKPIVVVDDFLTLTLKYDFGDSIVSSYDDVLTIMQQLISGYQAGNDQQLQLTHSIMRQYGYHYDLATMPEILSNTECRIFNSNAPSQPIISFFKDLYGCDRNSNVYAELFTEEVQNARFWFSTKHVFNVLKTDQYQIFSTYFPTVNQTCFDKLYSKVVGPSLEMTCDYVVPIVSNKIHEKPSLTWDASATCGWPLVSSFMKVLGGECEGGDINELKNTLSDIQKYSAENTALISALEDQVKILNERMNNQYENVQKLADTIQRDVMSQLKTFAKEMTSMQDAIDSNTRSIIYLGLAMRLYESLVDYRLAYIETINTFQFGQKYGNTGEIPISDQLRDSLAEIGYVIPLLSDVVPHTYSVVRYLEVSGSGYYNLEIDVNIPVVKSTFDNSTYHSAQLTPLPMATDGGYLIHRYSGKSICSDEFCYKSSADGFCYPDTNHYYCLRSYIDGLQPIGDDYQTTKTSGINPIYVPPNTIYFPESEVELLVHTYDDNVDRNLKSVAGSIYYASCNSSISYTNHAEKQITIDISKQLSCNNLASLSNVYLLTSTSTDIDKHYINITGPAFDAYAKRRHDELEKLFNDTVYANHTWVLDPNGTDIVLRDQFDALSKKITDGLAKQLTFNQHIEDEINSLKQSGASTPILFYIVAFIAVIIIIKIVF